MDGRCVGELEGMLFAVGRMGRAGGDRREVLGFLGGMHSIETWGIWGFDLLVAALDPPTPLVSPSAGGTPVWASRPPWSRGPP